LKQKIVQMEPYQCIFIDLDRTLWDFEANAREALEEIYEKHNLSQIFPGFQSFIENYRRYNHRLWEEYRNGKIEKELLKYVRFRLTLKSFGKNDLSLAKKLGREYVDISATKTHLFPHSHEVLSYLRDNYPLYIITNGFQEVQLKKIRNSGLEGYFEGIITSERAGVQKPHEDIFLYALEQAGTDAKHSLMIGDDVEGDIRGARAIGMDQVLFNPGQKEHRENPTYEIGSLLELKDIL